jgi:Domain of unknown function (DUF4429)
MSMASQQAPDIVSLAKQGNPKAIAALINRQLKPRGIETKASLRGECLEILLEATQVPDQHLAVQFIKKGLVSLNPNGIKTIKLFGRAAGEVFFDWENIFSLSINPIDGYFPVDELLPSSIEDKPKGEKPLKADNIPPYLIVGRNGQIKLTKKRVIISRKGFFGFLSQGMAGEKEIPVNRITAVQFKEPGSLTVGFLQFSILGGVEAIGGLGNAVNDENTVTFETHQQQEFKELKRYIDSIIDDEAIDFGSLDLPDIETAEKNLEIAKKNQIEVERLAQIETTKQFKASLMRFPNLLFSCIGVFLIGFAVFGGFFLGFKSIPCVALGLIMTSSLWSFVHRKCGFRFLPKHRLISAAFVSAILLFT